MPGWTIVIRDDSGAIIATTTTMVDDPGSPEDETGMYWLDNLPPGDLTVAEIPQDGWQQTFPAPPGSHAVTLQAGEIIDLVCYHEYGFADEDNPEECQRLAADIADKWLMIMHNHGLLSVGRTVAEAFFYLYTLENACKVQVDVMSSGATPKHIACTLPAFAPTSPAAPGTSWSSTSARVRAGRSCVRFWGNPSPIAASPDGTYSASRTR